MTPKEAFDFIQKQPDAVLVGCRSEFEFLFIDHPVGAILIAWYEGIHWDLDPHFLGQVRMAASHHPPLILSELREDEIRWSSYREAEQAISQERVMQWHDALADGRREQCPE